MTSTAPRHRVQLSRRARLASLCRPLARACAVPVGGGRVSLPLVVPVGVLAGCTALASATAAGPEVGLIGLGALVLPISVATWWGRSRAPGPGRHALGRPVLTTAAPAATPVTATDAPAAAVPVTTAVTSAVTAAVRPVPLVLEAPALAHLQAATGRAGAGRLPAGVTAEDTPSRLFTVSAGGHAVEVVLLTREEQAARDLRVLRALSTPTSSGARDAEPTTEPSLQPAA